MMARIPDTWRVDAIRDVPGRYRRNPGDLTRLAASIKTIGLINPLTVTSDGMLIAGGRRLAAVRSLGFTDVDVHIVETLGDVITELRVEAAEQTCRVELLPTEKVQHGELIQRADLRRDLITADMPNRRRYHETSNQVAKALGMGGTVYRGIRHLQRAAADQPGPESVRTLAVAALRDVDAGEGIERTVMTFRRDAERLRAGLRPEPEADPLHHNTRKRKIREETERLDALAAQASGMALGAEAIIREIFPLTESLDAQKAARWTSDLRTVRKALFSVIKCIKENTR